MNIPLAILFTVATKQFSLPTNLLSSLCYVESKHKVTAIHIDDGSEDSLGICQVHLSTAKWLGFKGTAKQLMNPQVNIHYAAKFLAYQRNRYPMSLERAIIAYNRGNAKGLTTTDYSVKVINKWRKSYVSIKERQNKTRLESNPLYSDDQISRSYDGRGEKIWSKELYQRASSLATYRRRDETFNGLQ